MRSQWIPLKHNDGRLTSAMFRIGIPFDESGPTANVIWELNVTSRSFAFTNREHRHLQVLVGDGVKVDLFEPEHKAELNPMGHGWLEKMSIKVRLDTFLDIALTKKATKGRLGPMEFMLGNGELELFRDLLSKVPSGKALDGGAVITVDYLLLEEDPTASPTIVKAAKAARLAKEKRESGGAAARAYREWASADGLFTIEAKLVTVHDDKVDLEKKDGRKVTMPLTSLSEADREFAAEQRKKQKPEEP